jgi:hypothetical protein
MHKRFSVSQMLYAHQFGAVKAAYEPIPTAIRAGLEQSDWPGVMTLVQGLDLVSVISKPVYMQLPCRSC